MLHLLVAFSVMNFFQPYVEFLLLLLILQGLEIIRSPCMIEHVVHSEDTALDHLQTEQENPETITGDSDGPQKDSSKMLKLSQVQLLKLSLEMMSNKSHVFNLLFVVSLFSLI